MDIGQLVSDRAAKPDPVETFTSEGWDREFPLYAIEHWTQKQMLASSFDRTVLFKQLTEIAGVEKAESLLDGNKLSDVFGPSREGKKAALEASEAMRQFRQNKIETALDMIVGYLDNEPEDLIWALSDKIDQLLYPDVEVKSEDKPIKKPHITSKQKTLIST